MCGSAPVWIQEADEAGEPIRPEPLLERSVDRAVRDRLCPVRGVVHHAAGIGREEQQDQQRPSAANLAARVCHEHRHDEGREQRYADTPGEELVPHPGWSDPDPHGVGMRLLSLRELRPEKHSGDREAESSAHRQEPSIAAQLVLCVERDARAHGGPEEQVPRDERPELTVPEGRRSRPLLEAGQHQPSTVEHGVQYCCENHSQAQGAHTHHSCLLRDNARPGTFLVRFHETYNIIYFITFLLYLQLGY